MITEIQAKTVLTFHEDAFPTQWDVNPYRGCSIGCRYCFAQYSHRYLGLDDFFRNILVKTNVAERLAVDIRKKRFNRSQVKIGGITDLYQPAEKRYELMPKIFEVIKRERIPIFIQTKSTLILRDFEIIRELSKITTVDIATSISTLDESIRRVVEPGASPTLERIEMLGRFKGICNSTTLGLMPIIPMLSDTDENLDAIFRLAKEHAIDHVVTSFLFLRGELKPKFLEVIQTQYPEIYPAFSRLYRSSTVDKDYAGKVNQRIEKLRVKYNVFGVYEPVTPNNANLQLSLF
ncbi:MAG: radical SAM protein [Bacteroidota bacterium]